MEEAEEAMNNTKYTKKKKKAMNLNVYYAKRISA